MYRAVFSWKIKKGSSLTLNVVPHLTWPLRYWTQAEWINPEDVWTVAKAEELAHLCCVMGVSFLKCFSGCTSEISWLLCIDLNDNSYYFNQTTDDPSAYCLYSCKHSSSGDPVSRGHVPMLNVNLNSVWSVTVIKQYSDCGHGAKQKQQHTTGGISAHDEWRRLYRGCSCLLCFRLMAHCDMSYLGDSHSHRSHM